MDTDQSGQSDRTVAAALYVGDVMHARMRPTAHRFQYRVMSLLIDLGRLDEAGRQSPLFAVNRRALYSFHERDHGRRDGSSLLAYAQACAAERGVDLTGGRVLLLCYPRLLGYVFNPLSVYFCYRSNGDLALMIYEVRNTFGELKPYVLPVEPHGDALPFPGHAAGRQCEVADSRDRRRWPTARRDLLRPPASADLALPARGFRLASACHVQDLRRHSLGGAAALDEGHSPRSAGRNHRHPWNRYRLGEKRQPRLYISALT
jgi:hypothetical protein